MTRLLYYPVSYMECGGSEDEAIKSVPLKDDEWFVVECDECADMFKIWHIIGDYR